MTISFLSVVRFSNASHLNPSKLLIDAVIRQSLISAAAAAAVAATAAAVILDD